MTIHLKMSRCHARTVAQRTSYVTPGLNGIEKPSNGFCPISLITLTAKLVSATPPWRKLSNNSDPPLRKKNPLNGFKGVFDPSTYTVSEREPFVLTANGTKVPVAVR